MFSKGLVVSMNEAIENIIKELLTRNYSQDELDTIQDFLDLLQTKALRIPFTWKRFADMLETALVKNNPEEEEPNSKN